MRWTALVLATTLAFGFSAGSGPSAAAPAEAAPLDRLRAYLRADTSNPPGNEIAGVRVLRAALEAAGIPSETFEPAPGRASLYARLRGRAEAPGLLLHHHVDVVPAPETSWETPPFGAMTRNGRLFGRGALDDKALGIAELEAFLALKRSGAPLSRDVVFLATADEENGGELGIAAIEAARPGWLAGVGMSIGEGGQARVIVDRAVFFGIETVQKSALRIRISAAGGGGHAASPGAAEPGTRIGAALGRIASWEHPLSLVPAAESYFRALGPTLIPARRDVVLSIPERIRTDPEGLRRSLPPGDLALLGTTVAITGLSTDSLAPNALPRRAEAVLDVRLLPGADPLAFVARLKGRIGDPSLVVAPLFVADGGPASPAEGLLWEAIVSVLGQRFPGAAVGPELGTGSSENRRLRSRGIATYGLLPFRVSAFDASGIHSINERIREDWFLEGVETVRRIVFRVAAPPAPAR